MEPTVAPLSTGLLGLKPYGDFGRLEPVRDLEAKLKLEYDTN